MTTPSLPTPQAFLAGFGIDISSASSKGEASGASAGMGAVAVSESEKAKAKLAHRDRVAQELRETGVSPEMRDLLIQYCTQMTSAYELEQIDWRALGRRLGTHAEYLAEAAALLNQSGTFWIDVLQARIKRAAASKIFRDNAWEQLESLAVNRLVELASRNLIRDTGELLAVASHARRASEAKTGGGNGAGVNVNISLGGESMDGGDNGLPAAGAKMTIDLSPRVASALREKSANAGGSGRVIDGQMLSAAELRSALESQKQEPATDEDELGLEEGEMK